MIKLVKYLEKKNLMVGDYLYHKEFGVAQLCRVEPNRYCIICYKYGNRLKNGKIFTYNVFSSGLTLQDLQDLFYEYAFTMESWSVIKGKELIKAFARMVEKQSVKQ